MVDLLEHVNGELTLGQKLLEPGVLTLKARSRFMSCGESSPKCLRQA